MKPVRLAKLLLAALALFGAALLPRAALAAGSVKLENQPEEVDGAWKLKFTIDYGSLPHLEHIPMIFSFEQTVSIERALTDQSPKNPVERRIPLQNQTPNNIEQDVGFSDGQKKFKITKYDFKIRRDKGFEAGDYKLTLKTTDGKQVGQTITVTLKGENPVIDRRAISFAGEPGKKKDPPKPEEKKDEPAPKPEDAPPPDASKDGGGQGQPEPVKPKQGGCGCSVPEPSSHGALIVGLGAAAVLLRRRSRRPGAERTAA